MGDWAGNAGHNVLTKVTADKLDTAWKRQKGGKDSDAMYGFLLKQGVPLAVVNDIYQRMGIPVSPQVRTQQQPERVGSTRGYETDATDAVGYGSVRWGKERVPYGEAPPSVARRLGGGADVGSASAKPTPPAAAAATVYPGEDPNGPNYVGRREVARRQAARAAAAKPAAAGVKTLNPYSKMTYTNVPQAAVGTVSGMKKPAAAAPTGPKVTSGPPTPEERANLEKRLKAATATTEQADRDHAFKPGDQVYVRNQIGSDRVIRVVGDQVYLSKMGRAPMRDVSRVNPGLGQQIKTAGKDVARGLRDFVTGKD